MTLHFNRSDQRDTRRRNRAAMPRAEVLLWAKLKGRQLLGFKFRRQYGVGSYNVDFYCAELKLAIELDGETHYVDGARSRDQKRQRAIETYGIRVLRFLNDDVYENLEGVWEAIVRAARERIEASGVTITSPRRERRRVSQGSDGAK
ncbi:MAG: endonuclease domain-containing protein [Planctomycetaceae bacterium]